MPIRRIILPKPGGHYRIVQVDDEIQIWSRGQVYNIPWLTNRQNKIDETITILKNANVEDYVFRVIAEVSRSFDSGHTMDPNLSFKGNIIKTLQRESDDIEWILSLGSSSSSSSSSSSLSSSSSSSASNSSSSSSSSSSSQFSTS